MFEFIKANQLSLMLLLCGACGILAILLLMTRFLSRRRKWILFLMEFMAFFLLWFDRMAYIYSGEPGRVGFIVVRVSNFMVFFLTSGIVYGFNLYLKDYLSNEGGVTPLPHRLKITEGAALAGMLLAVIAAFTKLYYYFDEANVYHRGPGFLIAYIIPVVCPILQYTVIRQYRKKISTLIYISLVLYIFVPIACGILQIFAYGISIVNMALVAVSISLYLFSYLDINHTVERAHEIELRDMEEQKTRLQKLFDQTARAFVAAVEKKDDFIKGNSIKVAEYAKRIAEISGKSDDECEKVYYAALLHDVGIIGIPDSVIKKEADPEQWDYSNMRQKPLIGNEILSSITEYPFLCLGAHYSHERYNGTGYPEGLKGEEIPEIARIIAVADAYVTMTTKKRYREAKPIFMAREALVRGGGEEFDPVFSESMIRIIDTDGEMAKEIISEVETELICHAYRDQVSYGIPIENKVTRVTFECLTSEDPEQDFSAPSVILFDSYDRRVHDNRRTIEAFKYLEYGELWFDDHSITTAARDIKERIIGSKAEPLQEEVRDGKYEITMFRYEDHLKLLMKSPYCEKEVIAALPNGSQASYLSLTGEHCTLRKITVEHTGREAGPEDIPRIVDEISYIDRMESDLRNVQIDRVRSASTQGIEVKDRLRIMFHTMSLPGANLVWHCPYIVLFYSDDGSVNGENYREYALIKLYGENEGELQYAHNHITVKKAEDFPGWDAWKEINKAGMECEVLIKRKNNVLVLKTRNLGIEVENTTTIAEDMGKVYAALTGDQVAITDIRVI